MAADVFFPISLCHIVCACVCVCVYPNREVSIKAARGAAVLSGIDEGK